MFGLFLIRLFILFDCRFIELDGLLPLDSRLLIAELLVGELFELLPLFVGVVWVGQLGLSLAHGCCLAGFFWAFSVCSVKPSSKS